MQNSEIEYIEYMKEVPMKCMVISIENSGAHWHYEYEIFFVMQGSVTVTIKSGKWKLEKGDMFLFNSKEIHSFSEPSKDNLCVVLQFSPKIIADQYKPTFHFTLNTKGEISLPHHIVARMQEILSEMALLIYEKPAGYPFLIKSCLYRFIGNLFRYIRYETSDGTACITSDDDLIEFDNYKQYIKTHFKEDINMERICKALGMSKSKLYRLIKSTGADTYKSLTNFYRIEYAKTLLANMDNAISNVATESGFESDSSFYRVFKELTGVSPNHYRAAPTKAVIPVGIQGYAAYRQSDAIAILRSYVSAGR
jgi:AraC-like DNA-binding protein